MAEEVSLTDSFFDRVRLVATAGLFSVVPLWLMLTVILGQVDASSPGEEIEVDGVVFVVETSSTWDRFVRNGAVAAGMIGAVGAVVMSGVWLVSFLRGRPAPGGESVGLLDDALVEGASWEVAYRTDGQAAPPPPLEEPAESLPEPEPVPVEVLAPPTPELVPPQEDETTEDTLDHLFR